MIVFRPIEDWNSAWAHKQIAALEQENKALKQTRAALKYETVNALLELDKQKEITRELTLRNVKTIERNLELDARMVEVVRVGEKMVAYFDRDNQSLIEPILAEWRALWTKK